MDEESKRVFRAILGSQQKIAEAIKSLCMHQHLGFPAAKMEELSEHIQDFKKTYLPNESGN